jgi:hypothetical protein
MSLFEKGNQLMSRLYKTWQKDFESRKLDEAAGMAIIIENEESITLDGFYVKEVMGYGCYNSQALSQLDIKIPWKDCITIESEMSLVSYPADLAPSEMPFNCIVIAEEF